jgi:DNA-binding SARP family transcriptional activator/predicted ATPase
MRISLFGNLRISYDDRQVTTVNTNRLQSLLAYLVLNGDTPVSRERLAYLLWPASAESQARTNLRQLLHHLKRALPSDCEFLQSDHFTVRWQRDSSCLVDALEFQTARAESAAARKSADLEGELRYLKAADSLYEDDLLPALYDDWLTPVRETYRNHLSEVLSRLASILEEQGRFTEAIPLAERLVTLDSLSETHHRLLIRLHDGNGDRASALRAYHRCMRVLRREMGVPPDAKTQELFDRILKADPETDSGPTSESQESVPAIAEPRPQKTSVLLGRENEWKRIEKVWQEPAEIGPRVAVISGEPGIGKTRFADEFSLSWQRRGLATARARCYPGQGQISYAPVAEWLSSEAVSAGLNGLMPAQRAELGRLRPEILAGIHSDTGRADGQPSDERWQRVLLHQSLNSAIGRVKEPLLLYLDDAQWCDTDSLDWMNALLTSSAGRRAFLLVTARSDETGREHPFSEFLAGLRQSVQVLDFPLEPLDAKDTAELARRESATMLEQEDLEEIFRDSRGNPLFIVESVRAGLHGGRVHAIIAARLAKLSGAAYELAGLASVVGRPFSFELMQRATDWDERSVAASLDELWNRRIIEGRGAEYDFTHDRIREVAQSELSLVRRRYWHRRTARALAELYEAEIESWNGQIAAHFENAEMAPEAIDYYSRAAISARRRYADAESANLLKRALNLCLRLPESERRQRQELDLLAELGLALVRTEGYSASEVGETYKRALDLFRHLESPNAFAILSGMWVFHVVRGDLEQAKRFGLDFLREAEKAPTPGLTLAGNFLMGCTLFHLGQLQASLHHMTLAASAQEGHTESVLALFAGPDIRVFCRSYLAQLAWHRGDDVASDTHSAEAIATARGLNSPFSVAIALDYATMLHAFRGESRAALELGTEAAEHCAGHGFTYYLAMANVLAGWARAAEGGVTEGLAQLRAGLESLGRGEAELRLPYYYALAAETLWRAGSAGEAIASLSTGFAFAGKNGEEWAMAELYRVRAIILASEGKADLAKSDLQQGIEAARRTGSAAFERKLSVISDGTAKAVSKNVLRTLPPGK